MEIHARLSMMNSPRKGKVWPLLWGVEVEGLRNRVTGRLGSVTSGRSLGTALLEASVISLMEHQVR